MANWKGMSQINKSYQFINYFITNILAPALTSLSELEVTLIKSYVSSKK